MWPLLLISLASSCRLSVLPISNLLNSSSDFSRAQSILASTSPKHLYLHFKVSAMPTSLGHMTTATQHLALLFTWDQTYCLREPRNITLLLVLLPKQSIELWLPPLPNCFGLCICFKLWVKSFHPYAALE